MTPARRHLFVCTGNACRSVMAEHLLLAAARRRSLPMEARSCGLAADYYFRVPAGTRQALARQGLSAESHRPQLVSPELMAWADVALAMTRAHCAELEDRFPQHRGKIHLLSRYAGLGEADVADPIGQPDDVHLACCEQIARAIEALTHDRPVEDARS